MRYAKLFFLLLGLALLAWVLGQANLEEIWLQVREVSFIGLLGIFIVYTLYFGADVVSWQVTFDSVEMTMRWAGRLFVVRMIGEAYNNITPMASMGGEPVKAWLLKTNYGIALRDSGASLVLAKTASMFSLVIFVAVAVYIALSHEQLGSTHKTVAIIGLAWLIFNVVVFFLMQHLKLSTFTATRLGKTRFGLRLGSLVAGMQSVDEQFARFYRHHRKRLALSMGYAMMNWLLGVAELYLILNLIGHAVSWPDALVIEATVQLIRTAAFFIPAGIGVQEGGLMLACGAITGSPNVGIAAALVRRFRELVWIGASLGLAAAFRVTPKLAAESQAPTDD
ncbi:MAG: lysylphosphatidylglycerol synthase domain-containing protein [Gammaproteobacteria bacterium]